MKNLYKMGIVSTALSSSLLAILPSNVFAENLPTSCTQRNFDAWSCYWLEGKITENMCGGLLAPNTKRMQAAAEQGNHSAAYRLGQLYASGTWGVKQNYAKAHYWLQQSAQGGQRDGQIELAKLYEFGRGVERNLQQALYWYKKAVSNGPYKGMTKKVSSLQKRLAHENPR